MAGVNQTSEGTWRIVDLCTHETENVYNLSIPIKLTYGGKSVETNISNTKKSLATEWKTALGTAINTNQISLSSGTATYGSTIYKINKINWGTVKPYEKPDSFTYSLVVSGSSYAAASYNDSLTFGAWYKTFNNGTLVNTENVTSNANCTWSVDKTALVSSINNGNVTFNNTGSTDTTIKITATYNGYTDNVDVTVPKKSDEPVQTYTLSFSGNVTGASIEVSGDKTYTYTGGTLVTEGQYVKNKTVSYTITKDGYDTINDSVKITGNTLEKFEMSESGGDEETYEFVVSGETTGTTETSTGYVNVGAWYITKVNGVVTKQENVTNETTWTITNGSDVATASTTTKGRIDYDNKNVSEDVGVTVKGSYDGNTGTTSFIVCKNTKKGQIIIVGSIMVASMITEASQNFECIDMVQTSLTATNTSHDDWITGLSIVTGASPVLYITATTNAQGTTFRTGDIRISGQDIYGNTINRDTTFTQKEPSSDDIPCESMVIQPTGSLTIQNQNNTQQFDLSYTPTFTTQHGAVWSLTTANGGAVSNDIAHLEEDEDPTLVDVRHLKVGTGATGQTLYLKATNSYKDSVVSNTVAVTVKYVGAGKITVNPTSLDSGFGDDRIDTTNGAPSVTATDLRGNLAWKVLEENSFIRTVEITNGRVLIYYTGVNTGAERYATIRLYDDADASTYADINIIQRAYEAPSTPNTAKILGIGGERKDDTDTWVLSPEAPQRIRFGIGFTNKDIVSQTFSDIVVNVTGTTEGGYQTFVKNNVSFDPILVPQRGYEYRVFTINNVEPTGPTSYYKMTISCRSMNVLINDEVTNWNGDDDMDIEPDPDVH